eukprot:Hpha_TRINITY_DN14948_c1_g3::TRINITY_DN14948_c1_g3_i1::g.144381::m.144381
MPECGSWWLHAAADPSIYLPQVVPRFLGNSGLRAAKANAWVAINALDLEGRGPLCCGVASCDVLHDDRGWTFVPHFTRASGASIRALITQHVGLEGAAAWQCDLGQGSNVTYFLDADIVYVTWREGQPPVSPDPSRG